MRSDDESGFLARTIPAADGLKLHVRDYVGDEAATGMRPAIFCLPGLTRNSRDFHQLALLLSRDAANPRRVITLDARGRGASEWDADKSHYNLVVEAQDVLTVCSALALPHAIFIGTSRGGLVLHVIAASRPDILKAVILNDIGPVLEKRGLADIRDYLNRDKKPSDWDDAVEILRENHGSAFSALSEDDWRIWLLQSMRLATASRFPTTIPPSPRRCRRSIWRRRFRTSGRNSKGFRISR